MSEKCTRFVEGKFFLNDSGLSIMPRDESALSIRFLDYLVLSLNQTIYKLGRGTAQKNLDVDAFRQIIIRYPKQISQQKRIVALLDEAFEGLSTAVGTAEKNLDNARELFVSYVVGIFGKGEPSWKITTLGTNIDLLTGFAFRSSAYTDNPRGIRLLRGDNVVQGELRWESVKRWPSADRLVYRQYELEPNDIVLAMDRTWVKAGIKFARISYEDVPALLVQRVARMRCRQTLSNGFLFHLLGSRFFEKYVLDIQTGLGVPHISGGQIQAFRFKMPNIHTQNRIVKNMDVMRTYCENLALCYEAELKLLIELKESFLKKALSGEFTARPERLFKKSAA